MPNTIRRNGVYYYRRRIPSDLVAAQAFGLNHNGKPVSQIKHSLKTKDPKEARRRLAIEDLRAEQLFEEKRAALRDADTSAFVHWTNPEEPTRSLKSLSGPERRDLALRWFIEMEKAARASHERDRGSIPQDELNEALSLNATDLSVLEGSDEKHGPPPQWDEMLKRKLSEMDIDAGETSSEEFRELRDLLSRAYIERSWRTLEALQGRAMNERDRAFRGLGSESPIPENAKQSAKTIAALCEDYISEREKEQRAAATLAKYKPQLKILSDYFGAACELQSITTEHARDFVEFLSRVPVNANKRYPGISLVKASEMEERSSEPKYLSPKTQSDVLDAVSSVFKYAADLDWIGSNPFKKKVVRSRLPVIEKQDKPMFSAAELSALFRSPDYLRERASSSNAARGEARFWVPLLCLFHGFRTNEVCQLLVEDVKREGEIDYLHIRETDDAGEKLKRFKNKISRRKVPLHVEVVKMGFVEFVKARRQEGDKFLFPSLKERIVDAR